MWKNSRAATEAGLWCVRRPEDALGLTDFFVSLSEKAGSVSSFVVSRISMSDSSLV